MFCFREELIISTQRSFGVLNRRVDMWTHCGSIQHINGGLFRDYEGQQLTALCAGVRTQSPGQ